MLTVFVLTMSTVVLFVLTVFVLTMNTFCAHHEFFFFADCVCAHHEFCLC